MYYFQNDYNEICCPEVFDYMQKTVSQQMVGYGEDAICRRAADKIRILCASEQLAVHFLSGGTQTNLTLIAAALRPHQAVLAADIGHIHVHETGAIEATGHKVIPLASADGKIAAAQIRQAVSDHWSDATHEHMPQPKLVYLSQPTELGTTYSLGELEAISRVCRDHGLYLYVDGARLGYALAADGNDVSMADLASLTDAFYVGGTKVGAMFGEALVISNPVLQTDFRYILKQRGGMLAKGWLMGIQFDALLTNGLYTRISRHANELADLLRETIRECGYTMPVESRTNQVFVRLPLPVCTEIEKEFVFSPWELPHDGYMTVRFCTSWATERQNVMALCETLRKCRNS